MSTILNLKTVADLTGAKQVNQAMDKVKKTTGKVNDAFDSALNKLDQMTGGAVTFGKQLLASTGMGAKGFKILRTAIISTGVGALVVAVGTLVSYFTNTQRGADKVNKVFKAIGATVDVLVDRLSTFGEGLFQILSLDFEAGLETLKSSFKGVGEEIVTETKAAYDLEDAFQRLEKRKIDFIVTEQKLRASIEEARLASENDKLTIEERNAANEKAIELEKKLAQEREAIAKEDLRIQKERNELGESSNEDVRQERELEAELFRIQSERDTKLKELISKRRALNAEIQKGNDLKREEILVDAQAIQSRGIAEYEEFEVKKEKTKQEIQQENFLKKQLAKINQDFAVESNSIETTNVKNKKKAAEQELAINDTVNKSLAAGIELLGRTTEEGKALAASQALFNTYLAINKTLAAFSGAPIPGYAIAQSIATGLFGLAQVKNILSTNTSGSGSFSSGGSFASGSTPPREDNFQTPEFGFLNQGVGGTQNAEFGASRSYVVLQDIRDKESLDERIRDSSRLG